jgi:hypothetical protein
LDLEKSKNIRSFCIILPNPGLNFEEKMKKVIFLVYNDKKNRKGE